MEKKEVLSFTIESTTGITFPVSIVGNLANLADNGNATTLYSWDITGIVLTNETILEIQVATEIYPVFSIVSANLIGTTQQDIVDTLNSLGIGGFGLYDTGLNQYVQTYNMQFNYGYLNIYNPLIVPTTFAGFLTDAASTLTFEINAVPQVTFAGAVVISGTYNASVGDTLNINGTSGAFGDFIKVIQYPDNTTLYLQALPPLTPFTFSWVAAATKNYSVQTFP